MIFRSPFILSQLNCIYKLIITLARKLSIVFFFYLSKMSDNNLDWSRNVWRMFHESLRMIQNHFEYFITAFYIKVAYQICLWYFKQMSSKNSMNRLACSMNLLSWFFHQALQIRVTEPSWIFHQNFTDQGCLWHFWRIY